VSKNSATLLQNVMSNWCSSTG